MLLPNHGDYQANFENQCAQDGVGIFHRLL
jgi:hypothetical protein